MKRAAFVVIAAIALVACNPARKPESSRLREAYELLAYGCSETKRGGAEADEVLLKTWLAVHGRYPYETNLIRAANETKPDERGKYFGELTSEEVQVMDECRARADKVAGIDVVAK